MQPSRRFFTSSARQWFPQARATLASLPEYASAQTRLDSLDLSSANSELQRAQEICHSIFGNTHLNNAPVLADRVKVSFLQNQCSKGFVLLTELADILHGNSSEAVDELGDSEDPLSAVRSSVIKCALQCGNTKAVEESIVLWAEGEVSPELASTISVAQVLLDHDNSTMHERCLDLVTGDLPKAYYFQNLAIALFLMEGKDAPHRLDILKKAENVLHMQGLPKVDTVTFQQDCTEVAQSSAELLNHYAILLNQMAVEDPEGCSEHKSKALQVAEVLADTDTVYNATLGVVLGSIARDLHTQGQAVSSEGLYTAATDSFDKVKTPTVPMLVSKKTVMLKQALLLDDWENRESDAASLRAKIEGIDSHGSKIGCEFTSSFHDWSLD